MIIDSLENSARWEALNPLFAKVFEYLKIHDFSKDKAGKIILEENNVWINVSENNCKKAEDAFIENHREYIDIQLLLEGTETFGWKESSQLKTVKTPYNAERDITFYNDAPSTYFTLQPGQFVILYPEDGHAPCIGEGKIKKLIVKVRV